jgi:signal transduction histidine kinase
MGASLRGWLASVALLLAAAPLWAAEPVRIGVLAFRPKPVTLAQWHPLETVLKRQIPGRDFEIEALDYDELNLAVASRRLDFVLTNPGHYVLLAHRSGLSAPLATLVNADHGRPMYAYGGTIIAPAASDVRTLSDVRDRLVATVTREALAGYQMQAYELAIRGIPAPAGKLLVETGMPHDRVVEAVLAGRAEVGFLRSSVIEQMAHEGKLDPARIRVLNPQDLPGLPSAVSTRLYPEWPFAALPHIDEHLARNVAAALFLLDRDPAVTRAMGIHSFTVPSDYAPVEELLRELRLPPFDAAPRFTLADVWRKYRGGVLVSLLLAGLVALLSVRLTIANRRLHTDVEARRQAEAALAQSNAELEQFAYSVSHDMRQPLRMVSGHLQLLEQGLGGALDADLRENLHFALDGAKRMDSMIVSLLDYSRVGRKTEAKAWMPARDALDEALGFLEPLLRDTGAKVSEAGDWPRVYASRDELTRLFQNLIGNAIKFHEAGKTPRVEIESAAHGETWRGTVRDHGIGIDPSQLDRLFQFFSRLQPRERFEGTGMGLALCRRIVEHHGGRIRAESEGEGRGSTFAFELPLGRENAAPSGSGA